MGVQIGSNLLLILAIVATNQTVLYVGQRGYQKMLAMHVAAWGGRFVKKVFNELLVSNKKRLLNLGGKVIVMTLVV